MLLSMVMSCISGLMYDHLVDLSQLHSSQNRTFARILEYAQPTYGKKSSNRLCTYIRHTDDLEFDEQTSGNSGS